jgi:hypothetical protein
LPPSKQGLWRQPIPFVASTPLTTIAPILHEATARCSTATLTGSLDIADAHLTQVSLEFANEGLSEWKVTGQNDTGSDLELATQILVDELVKSHLVSPYKLRIPIRLGAINTKNALTITHAVTLPFRIGDQFFTHNFGIAPIPAPPHLIFGRPFLRKYCPDALDMLERIGFQTIGKPPTTIAHGLPTPTNSPPLSPRILPKTERVLALPPCSDPRTAFFAGGGNPILAAIESEEHRRKLAAEKHATCLQTLIQIDYELESRFLEANVRASSAKGTTDPGVRGLTGNEEGWLDTIPPEFQRFANTIFSDDAANDLPNYRPNSDCVIKLREGAKLRQSKLYDMSQEELTHLKNLLDLELQRGFIRPSKSESSAPVFFVRDPSSGTRSGQLRLVVDFRDLNRNIEQDEYPIPLTRTVMNDLAGADWVTSMDVRSGFSNIRVAPGSEHLTAFKTFYGLFEYTVMPMGLSTAPAVFQRFINSVLNPYLGIFCHAYLDDVVIYTKGSLEEHRAQVLKVLEALDKNGLRLKPKKCKWFRKECDFLGFTVVCGKGVRMAQDKIQGIRDLQPPRGVSDLRSFLGVLGFYDKFIPHYSDTTACLTALLKKDAPWVWTPACQQAFETLKTAIREDIFIRAFVPGKRTRLSTDASDVAYAGVMEQEYKDGWFPFLIFHHKFREGEKGWDIHDKELFAIVHAFDHYRHYLSQTGSPVEVLSDHRNLAKFMFSTDLLKSHDGRLGRWWQVLSQSNFEIQYLPGPENVYPDFLSRYGFNVSTDLPERVLLPMKRFSPKALADIESWFKKSSSSPNIRALLEKRFAKSENQISSPVPVPEPPTPPSPDPMPFQDIACLRAPTNPMDFPHQPHLDGISRCASAPQVPIRPKEFSLQTQRLGQSLGLCLRPGSPDYHGASLDAVSFSTNHRKGPDRRGIGA